MSWAFPALASDPVAPLETVEKIYANVDFDAKSEAVSDIPLPMTAELGDLLAEDIAQGYVNKSGIGRLDFDWMFNGQDAQISNLEVERTVVAALASDEPKREVITARFDNFETPTRITYYWTYHDQRGWVIKDVTGWSEDGLVWTLSLLLKYGI